MDPSTKSHPVDQHVGARVRSLRRAVGMSQGALAERIGLTFQQVQKYERGANRVSASKLYEIAAVLGVPLIELFDGLPPTNSGPNAGASGRRVNLLCQLLRTRDGEAVAEHYPRIRSSRLRRALADLIRMLATGEA